MICNVNQSIRRFLGGLSSGTILLDPPETVSWGPASSQEKTFWTGVSWGDDEMLWMILLMSRLPGGHSRSAGQWLEKLGYQQLAVCWWALPGDWCRQNAATDDWVGRRYPSTSPRTTLSRRQSWTRFSQGRAANWGKPTRRRCGRIAAVTSCNWRVCAVRNVDVVSWTHSWEQEQKRVSILGSKWKCHRKLYYILFTSDNKTKTKVNWQWTLYKF